MFHYKMIDLKFLDLIVLLIHMSQEQDTLFPYNSSL